MAQNTNVPIRSTSEALVWRDERPEPTADEYRRWANTHRREARRILYGPPHLLAIHGKGDVFFHARRSAVYRAAARDLERGQ